MNTKEILKDSAKKTGRDTWGLIKKVVGNVASIPKAVGKAFAYAPATLVNQVAGKQVTTLGAKPGQELNKVSDQKFREESNKEIGTALTNAATSASLLAGSAGTASGRVAYNAIPGAMSGVAQSFSANKPEDAWKNATISALTQVAVSGLLEGAGVLLKKALSSKTVQEKAEDVYNKTYTKYSPEERKRLAQQSTRQYKNEGAAMSQEDVEIENAMAKTLGYKMKKYGFVGSDEEIARQSGFILKNDGTQLNAILKTKNDVLVPADEIKSRVMNSLTNDGANPLPDAMIKDVENQINALVTKKQYTPLELNELKRAAYDIINPKNWTSEGVLSIKTDTQMSIASNAAKLIDELVDDPTVKLLNDRMSAALSASKISGMKIANARIGGSVLQSTLDSAEKGSKTAMGTIWNAAVYLPRKIAGSQSLRMSIAQMINKIGNSNADDFINMPAQGKVSGAVSNLMTGAGATIGSLIPNATANATVENMSQENQTPLRINQSVKFDPSKFGFQPKGESTTGFDPSKSGFQLKTK